MKSTDWDYADVLLWVAFVLLGARLAIAIIESAR